MIEALDIEVRAPVVSFRNPLYAGVQAGLPCPPPATVGGMLAAVAGGWGQVPSDLRFGMSFTAAGQGDDLETYHPLDASGSKADPTPKDRPFLAEVTLRIWLVDGLERWERALRRPVWPLRLGRSQDLATARTRRVRLVVAAGRQGHAVVPADRTSAGTLLQLPTAISHDRSRTRWHAYRYHPDGSRAEVAGEWVTEDGQAVALLPPVHPDQFAGGDVR
ncbi:MAG TPA: CRISPR-associated protein Cas5 [Pseudonocardiaceae bacterium]|jgi:CRISPR-associated Cas5-like protein|nr:CRISPR-associated protein Cas5 [Pseudonocardiaceae bacterium]